MRIFTSISIEYISLPTYVKDSRDYNDSPDTVCIELCWLKIRKSVSESLRLCPPSSVAFSRRTFEIWISLIKETNFYFIRLVSKWYRIFILSFKVKTILTCKLKFSALNIISKILMSYCFCIFSDLE